MRSARNSRRAGRYLLAWSAVACALAYVAFATADADVFFFGTVLVVAPILILATVAGLWRAADDDRHRLAMTAVILASLWIAMLIVFGHEQKQPLAVRETVRWLLWSPEYKRDVLSQPTPVNGGPKHIEWDGWGFAGMNTTLYLVADPTERLVRIDKAQIVTHLNSAPCNVQRVRRLERGWYAVLFYTQQTWEQCT
jgi:hypothetical protein